MKNFFLKFKQKQYFKKMQWQLTEINTFKLRY